MTSDDFFAWHQHVEGRSEPADGHIVPHPDDVRLTYPHADFVEPQHADNDRAIALLEQLASIKDRSAEEDALAPAPASPLDTLLELMAANNLKSKDIAELIGSKGNASDVLHGKRKISRTMAETFGARFNVPHALFL